MSRIIIPLKLEDSTLLSLTLIKVFKTTNSILFLAGSEFNDHDMWIKNDSEEYLTLYGTLSEPMYNNLKKVKHKTMLTLTATDFQWLNTGNSGEIQMEASTISALKFDVLKQYAGKSE